MYYYNPTIWGRLREMASKGLVTSYTSLWIIYWCFTLHRFYLDGSCCVIGRINVASVRLTGHYDNTHLFKPLDLLEKTSSNDSQFTWTRY